MIFEMLNLQSLKIRLTGVAVLWFLAGFLLLFFFATWELRRDLQEQMGAQQYSITALLADEINDELVQRMAMLERVARGISAAHLAKPADLQALLEQRPLLHSLFNGGVAACDITGVVVADVPLSTGRVGVNLMFVDSVAAALKEGRSTVGRPAMGMKLRAPVFTLAVPIRDDQGAVIGVLGGVVNLEQPNFLEHIFENHIGKAWGYILVAPEHRLVVTATDKKLVLRELPADTVGPLANRFLAGYEGWAIGPNLAGVEVLASAKRIPVASWYLASGLPTAEAFTPIGRAQQRIAMAAAAVALLVAALTWLSLRRALRPVFVASHALKTVIAASGVAQSGPLKRGDELSVMLRATTRLIETLQQREAALRASEATFRGIFENASVGIAQTDRSGKLIHFNEAFRKMLGYDADVLMCKRNVDFTHEDDLQRTAALFNEILAGQRTHYRLTKRYLIRDGSLLWVDISVAAICNAQGAVESLIAVVVDVTHSQQMEDLRTREALQQAILNALPAEVAVMDTLGVIRMVNRPWERFAIQNAPTNAHASSLNGVGANYLTASLAGAAQGVPMAQEAVEGIRAVMERRQSSFSLSYPCHAPHQPRWFTMHVLPLGERADEGVVITHTEITELKLTEEALVLARDESEHANRAKSNFLASMSHELRTPLNSILGFAQLMDYDATLPQAHKDNVQEILESGRYLLQLINEILDLAKVESGHAALEMAPVALDTVVHECLNSVANAADAHRVILAYEPQPGAGVRADRTRLRQVLLNLLSNAIKYNVEGGHVQVRIESGDDSHLRVVVQDTGPGIAAERMGELFLPFSRLGAEGSGIEGTGIGLNIAQRIAEMMGSTVGVESEVGVGSRFWVELPRETLPDPDSVTRQESLQARQSTAEPVSAWRAGDTPCRVLYIEDNLVNLRLVAKILARRPSIEVLTAPTPAQGIALALAHHPALILLDINMPGMDGYAVLAILKADPVLASIPVVAVTANAMAGDIERGMAAGFSDYLTKPLDMPRFDACIDRWLDSCGTAPCPR